MKKGKWRIENGEWRIKNFNNLNNLTNLITSIKLNNHNNKYTNIQITNTPILLSALSILYKGALIES